MRASRAFIAAMLLVTLGAFAIRSVDLGNRPMHGDEAVHAEKFRDLWENGSYRYDSNEYHGPTIYYAALPSVILHGRKSWPDTREADYRLPIAVFGAAMILLLLPLAKSLGRPATLIAAIFIAISPAFVFYSRYFIQEIPFVFFTLGMIVCGWRYGCGGPKRWLVMASVFAGFMIASKETFVLTFLALGAAAGFDGIYHKVLADRARKHDDENVEFPPGPGHFNPWLNPQTIGIAVAIAIVTGAIPVTNFGSNLAGVIGYVRSYAPWFHRAQGASIHNHPFSYYLQLLTWTHRAHGGIWSEACILILAVIGALRAMTCSSKRPNKGDSYRLWRFLTVYTIALTFVYSVIPYKTPWCLLSFLLGMCLLGGLGAVSIVEQIRPAGLKAAACFVLSAAAIQLANQAYRASFVSYADPGNPYVYAATASDIVNLQKRIDELAKYWPEHQAMIIKVFAPDNYYWPIPWYLRNYPNVGYYSHSPQSKGEAQAPVTLCDSSLEGMMDPLLADTDLMNGYNAVRTGVFYDVYIRMDVWTAYLNGKNGGAVRRFAPPPPAQ